MVENGFDFDFFSAGKREEIEGLPPKGERPVALYAGRWEPVPKRCDLLLRLAKHFSGITWIFALDREVEALQDLPNVIALKEIPYDAMPALYAAADFSIQLSLYESFGNLAIESLAAGLPCIGTDVGVIPEAYRGSDLEQLLIENTLPNDNERIFQQAVETVERFLATPEHYRQELKKLYPRLRERYSLERWRQEMAEALELSK